MLMNLNWTKGNFKVFELVMGFVIFNLHSFVVFILELVSNFVTMGFNFLNYFNFALIKDVARMLKAY